MRDEQTVVFDFSEVFAKARPTTIGFLISKGSSVEEAEDLYQDACLKMWEYYKDKNGSGNYSVDHLDRMIDKVARQLGDNHRQRKARRPSVCIDTTPRTLITTDGIEKWEDQEDFRQSWSILLAQSDMDEFTLRMLLLYYRQKIRLARRMHLTPRALSIVVSYVIRRKSQFPTDWLAPFIRPYREEQWKNT